MLAPRRCEDPHGTVVPAPRIITRTATAASRVAPARRSLTQAHHAWSRHHERQRTRAPRRLLHTSIATAASHITSAHLRGRAIDAGSRPRVHARALASRRHRRAKDAHVPGLLLPLPRITPALRSTTCCRSRASRKRTHAWPPRASRRIMPPPSATRASRLSWPPHASTARRITSAGRVAARERARRASEPGWRQPPLLSYCGAER